MYKFETHIHTKESSACGKSSAKTLVNVYRRLGYSGMIVTDHFLNGNTNVPSGLPWEDRIQQFCMGFDAAAEEAADMDFSVFFGIEYNFFGTEFLLYNVDRQFLIEHPDMLDWDIEEFFTRFRAHGAFIIHAHPFREADYISECRLFPSKVDAVEVYNARNPQESYNAKAYAYAMEHSLPMTSGSDCHGIDNPGGGGICLHTQATEIGNIISGITSGDSYLHHLFQHLYPLDIRSELP